MARERPTIEVLYFDGCPNHEPLLARLHELMSEAGVEAAIDVKRIDSPQAAERERFLGSPSLRINGTDVDPTAGERTDYGLKCRLYATGHGVQGTVPNERIRTALEQVSHRRPST